MGWWPFGGASSDAADKQPAAPAAAAAGSAAEKPKKKICCACPDTKVRAEQLTFSVANYPCNRNFDSPTPLLPLQRLRDECIAMHTEEHPYCKALIEAHLACLRLEGFNVSGRGLGHL